MTNLGFDIDQIKAQAEQLVTNFKQLNANFAKMPKDERVHISKHEQQLNEAINNLKNEFGITK